MSSEWELDEGIKSIKSAWRREHTARCNLEKMLENAESENAKLIVKLNAEHIVRQNVEVENARLRKACAELAEFLTEAEWLQWPELRVEMRELGVEVDG